MSYRVNVDKGSNGTNIGRIHVVESQDSRCQPTDKPGWIGPFTLLEDAKREALNMSVPHHNLRRCKICFKHDLVQRVAG